LTGREAMEDEDNIKINVKEIMDYSGKSKDQGLAVSKTV
jgi:hypothetical protein